MINTESIKAARLDSSHIGKTVRVRLGNAEAQDVLVGVTLNTGSIVQGRFEGKNGVTLTFQQLGTVELGFLDKVTVVDEVKA